MSVLPSFEVVDPPDCPEIVTLRFTEQVTDYVGTIKRPLRLGDPALSDSLKEVIEYLFAVGEVKSLTIHPALGWRIVLRKASRRKRLEGRLSQILEPVATLKAEV